MKSAELEKSDNQLLQEISEKLSELIALIGITGKQKSEQIKYLVEFGFSNANIARLIGVPKGTVDTIRASQKKKK
jgi:predicted RNA-binding protein Jag